jgi:pimeloyl-ACP methyl ester carboxylesterase
LPAPREEFTRFVASARVDWTDPDSVVEYLVDYMGVLTGGSRPFDEDATRQLVRRDLERAKDFSAAQNHDVIDHGEGSREPLSSIAAPTLVIHGTADPMFPVEHGEALAAEIPNARLLELDGAGHGVYREDWEAISLAILGQTR